MEQQLTKEILLDFLNSTGTNEDDLTEGEKNMLNIAVRYTLEIQQCMIRENRLADETERDTLKHLRNAIDSITAIKEGNAYNALLDTISKVLSKALLTAL
jgi:hypothetical protein